PRSTAGSGGGSRPDRRSARSGPVGGPGDPYGGARARGLGGRLRVRDRGDRCGRGQPSRASEPESAAGGPRPGPTISIMPTTDLAPFHLAARNGYFEGVHVETVTALTRPGVARRAD